MTSRLRTVSFSSSASLGSAVKRDQETKKRRTERKQTEIRRLRILESRLEKISADWIADHVKILKVELEKTGDVAKVLQDGNFKNYSVGDLVENLLPVMVWGMVDALEAEVVSFQKETRAYNAFHKTQKRTENGRRSLPFSEKASTATEWLQENAEDLQPIFFNTPFGLMPVNLVTEYPDWMKGIIQDR
jgi:hypothetical protein